MEERKKRIEGLGVFHARNSTTGEKIKRGGTGKGWVVDELILILILKGRRYSQILWKESIDLILETSGKEVIYLYTTGLDH